MIKKSFIFLDGISHRGEQNIWKRGIHDWNSFLNAKRVPGISDRKKAILNDQVEIAKFQLIDNNAPYFAKKLPSAEHWRLYDQFKDEVCFLDIESSFDNRITVIGMYDGNNTKIMVDGFNLENDIINDELSKYNLLVTFNGKSFDVPMIKRYFNTSFPMPHLDLRHAGARIGLNGGLKNIEKEIGIKRAEEVEHIVGDQAPQLWRCWKATGDKRFLDLLVKYNEEDIVNLKPLTEYVIPRLWDQTKIH